MVFGKGSLREFFRDESSGEGRIAPPDAAARLQAEEESRPVDVFNPTVVNRSERERLERYNMAQKDGSSLMGAGLEAAKEKKEKEDRRMMDEFYERAILGHMTPAQWDAQMTWVGGIQMTNAEAQKLRKSTLANFDTIFDRCVANGQFKEEDRDKLKTSYARYVELIGKERLNTQTGEEKEELRTLREDKDMQRLDAAIVDSPLQFTQKGLTEIDRTDNYDFQQNENPDQKNQLRREKAASLLASEFAEAAGDFSTDPAPANDGVLEKTPPAPATPSGPA